MPQSKERKAEYQREHRKLLKGEVPIKEVPALEVPLRGLRPDGSFILSDGQVWWPDKTCVVKEHPSVVQMGILRGDLKARRKRIERYRIWLEVGKPLSGSVLIVDDVGVIPEVLASL